MKYPIEWYENCLKNSKQSEENLKVQLTNLQQELVKLQAYNLFRQFQIDQAKVKKMDSFDADRFEKSERLRRGII